MTRHKLLSIAFICVLTTSIVGAQNKRRSLDRAGVWITSKSRSRATIRFGRYSQRSSGSPCRRRANFQRKGPLTLFFRLSPPTLSSSGSMTDLRSPLELDVLTVRSAREEDRFITISMFPQQKGRQHFSSRQERRPELLQARTCGIQTAAKNPACGRLSSLIRVKLEFLPTLREVAKLASLNIGTT